MRTASSELTRKLQNGELFAGSAGRIEVTCCLRSAVFTWTNLLVVVAELDGNENEALDLVPLVTNVVLEVSHLIN